MISAGEVGAIFTVKDDATATLTRLAEEFNRLEIVIDRIKESIGTIGNTDGGLAKLAEQFKLTGTSGEDAGRVIAESFGRVDGAIDGTQRKLAELKTSFAETAAAAKEISVSVPGTGGIRRRAEEREPVHPSDVHLRSPSVETPVGHTSFGGDSLTPGAVLVGGGWLTDKLLDQGGDLVTQQKLLRDRLGIRGSEANVDEATKAAVRYATGGPDGIIGTTPSENLKGINELLSVTPDLDSAIKMYPTMMRGAKDLEELSGGKTKAAESMKTIAKALENMGGGIDPKTHELSPERMQTAMNEAVKTIIAGGGFINDATLFGLAKQSGGMGRMTDPGHFFDETITSLIDVGGQRTGTALAALGRQFLGDKMTGPVASELESLGILPHGSWKKAGGGIQMEPGFNIKGIDEIKSGDLPGFFNDVIGPAVRAKVGDSNEALMEESYKLFGQQTGQRLGLMYLQNEAQRKRDVALKNGVDPDRVYQGIGDHDYGANKQNLGTAIEGLGQVFGANAIPGAITALSGLASFIQGLTRIAAEHPAISNAALGFMNTPSLLMNTFKTMSDTSPWYKPSSLPGAAAPVVQAPPLPPGSAAAPVVQAPPLPPGPHDPFSPMPTLHNEPSIAARASAMAAPVVNVQPALTMTTLPVSITVDNGGLIGAVTKVVDARITAALSGLMGTFKSSSSNSSAGFDGRAAPSTPDASVMHGGH